MAPVYEGPTAADRAQALSAAQSVIGRPVYAERAILEDVPFVEIPTYCASFCLIYIWHGKFHSQR